MPKESLPTKIGSFFKPRTKTVEYETEASLPGFHIDVNGFVLFDEPALGGVGIMEVTPTTMTQGITHLDLRHPEESTDEEGYVPKDLNFFADRRKDAIPQWMNLLSAIQPQDDLDDPVHIQVLLKKVRTKEWDTVYQYEARQSRRRIEDWFEDAGYSGPGSNRRRGSRVMKARANDYVSLLKALDAQARGTQGSLAAAHMSDLHCYLVISYTPSSEGWWLDGRDQDFYVTDDYAPTNLFKADKIVERLGGRRVRKDQRKRGETEFNTADMLFPIQSDMTAQVIETRMRKIERAILAYDAGIPEDTIAFTVRRLHTVESTVLISMFPDIIDPHAEKVWGMGTNYEDVLYGMRVQMAQATGDASLIPDIGDQALRGTIDLTADAGDEEAFLSQFVGTGIGDSQTFGQEYDDANAPVTLEGDDDDADAENDPLNSMWGELDPSYTVTPRKANGEEKFLKAYAGKGVSADRMRAMERAAKAAKKGAAPQLDDDLRESIVGANVQSQQLLAEERLRREDAKRHARKRRAAERNQGQDSVDELGKPKYAAKMGDVDTFSANQSNPYLRGLGMEAANEEGGAPEGAASRQPSPSASQASGATGRPTGGDVRHQTPPRRRISIPPQPQQTGDQQVNAGRPSPSGTGGDPRQQAPRPDQRQVRQGGGRQMPQPARRQPSGPMPQGGIPGRQQPRQGQAPMGQRPSQGLPQRPGQAAPQRSGGIPPQRPAQPGARRPRQ